jgi:hypothetical protein
MEILKSPENLAKLQRTRNFTQRRRLIIQIVNVVQLY